MQYFFSNIPEFLCTLTVRNRCFKPENLSVDLTNTLYYTMTRLTVNIFSHLIELTSIENITIEAKTPQRIEQAEELTDIAIHVLNELVDSIHVLSSESELEQLYESIEDFIRSNKEDIENINLQDLFQELDKKIRRYAKLQQGNRFKILARFLKFITGIKKNYDANVESSKGSLILTVTFSTQYGYNLYKKDLKRGKIGENILELILYPPYLSSFDLKAEDLVLCLNGQELTQDSGKSCVSNNFH